MLGSNVQVLKQKDIQDGTLVLTKSVKHSYGFTKAGRGTIKTRVSYSVYLDTAPGLNDLYFGAKKSDANKIFKIVSRVGLAEYQRALNICSDFMQDFNKTRGV